MCFLQAAGCPTKKSGCASEPNILSSLFCRYLGGMSDRNHRTSNPRISFLGARAINSNPQILIPRPGIINTYTLKLETVHSAWPRQRLFANSCCTSLGTFGGDLRDRHGLQVSWAAPKGYIMPFLCEMIIM